MSTLKTDVEEITNILVGKRFELADELILQAQLQNEFRINFIKVEIEKKLGPKSRVDFYYNKIAVEVKVKGNPMSVFKQLERYATFPEVHAIILVTSKSFVMPDYINGKPCFVFSLSRAWL